MWLALCILICLKGRDPIRFSFLLWIVVLLRFRLYSFIREGINWILSCSGSNSREILHCRWKLWGSIGRCLDREGIFSFLHFLYSFRNQHQAICSFISLFLCSLSLSLALMSSTWICSSYSLYHLWNQLISSRSTCHHHLRPLWFFILMINQSIGFFHKFFSFLGNGLWSRPSLPPFW